MTGNQKQKFKDNRDEPVSVLVDVRMLVFDAPYQPGEVVKVNARRAERWVKEGIAEYAR